MRRHDDMQTYGRGNYAPTSLPAAIERFEGFRLSKSKHPPNMCKHAVEFSVWVDELVRGMKSDPTPAAINLAIRLLVENYLKRYDATPKPHREKAGDKGHICIFGVFSTTVEQILHFERNQPPPANLATAPPPVLPEEFAGIVLGEVEEEEA